MAGESTSSGSSFSTSQSTSVPVSVDSAQTQWGLLQSQLYNTLADQQQQWAMTEYARGGAITDQTVANFLEMSGKGKGLADVLLRQYSDQIKPLMDQYIRDAGSYASEDRQAFEAGKAMSSVAQADAAAMSELKRSLGDYGANVNQGKTQEMMIAERVKDAAARAGAGTAAAERTEATGRQMTEKALQMGQNIPGQAINAVQSAYAGLTGAENAILGLMNTGVNLQKPATETRQTAVAANKVPPVGQRSQSSSQGGSQQQSKSQQRDPEKHDKDKEQQPRQQAQPKGQGQGPGEGGGPGGGRGGGQAATRAEATPGGMRMPPTKTGDKDERGDEGTGAPDPYEYYGAVPYTDANGNMLPQYSPDTFETGKQFGPDTPQWENAEKVNDWSMHRDDLTQFNVDPASIPSGGGNFGNDWPGQQPFVTPYGLKDPFAAPGDANAPTWDNVPTGPTYGRSEYNDYGDRQNFSEYDNYNPYAGQSAGDYQEYDNYNPYAGQSAGDYQEYDNYNPYAGQSAGDYQEYDNYDPWGGQNFTEYDNYNAQSNYPEEYDNYNAQSNYPEEYDNYNAQSNYPEEYDNYSQSYPEEYDNYSQSYPEEYDNYSSSGDTGWYENDDGGYYSDSGYGGEEFSGDSEDYYDRGGPVRSRPQRPAQQGVLPTSGGAVPRSASPSRGQQTDDISARLNAGEYVIPRDVVKHQGTKFFSDLIAKSRKLRTGMAGAAPKPTMKRALPPGRPGFTSRPLPGR